MPEFYVKGKTFGEAIEILKKGGRVARAGWNGKNMWLALTAGSVISKSEARSGAALKYAETGEVDLITIGSHIDMKSADGSIVVGWLASQTDMLAEDWVAIYDTNG